MKTKMKKMMMLAVAAVDAVWRRAAGKAAAARNQAIWTRRCMYQELMEQENQILQKSKSCGKEVFMEADRNDPAGGRKELHWGPSGHHRSAKDKFTEDELKDAEKRARRLKN